MAIRFVDTPSRLGRISVAFDDLGSLLSGTHVGPPGRTGQLAGLLDPLTMSGLGTFSAAPGRTGSIVATLGALTSSIQGTFRGPVNFVPFALLPSPTFDGTEWFSGQNRGVRDSVTGDLVLVCWKSSDSNFALYGSQNNGATWSKLAADVSNPESGRTIQYPNNLMSVAQDSAGKVHAISTGKQGNTSYYYMRFALTRAGGHVTGFSFEQAPFVLGTNHGRTGFEIRGNIYVMKLNGAEVLTYTYGINRASSLIDCNFYAGRTATLAPTSSADFVKFSGAAGDDLLYSSTGDDNQKNHDMEGMLCQNESSEDVYFIFGHINADEEIGGSGTAFDIKAVRIAKSGSTWAIGATTTVSANSGTEIPMLCDTDSASDKAWLMFMSSTGGIQFSYFDSSGTLHSNAVTSPLNTSPRAAFGTFTAGDDGKLWTIFNTYGTYQNLTPVGKLGYWDGSSWVLQDDPSAKNCVGIAGVGNWANGCLALRFDGDVVAQTVANQSIAAVYSS